MTPDEAADLIIAECACDEYRRPEIVRTIDKLVAQVRLDVVLDLQKRGLISATEREACAQIAENHIKRFEPFGPGNERAQKIAAAIRARGDTP